MKKIMFNDKYGLTEAVLSGRKTQTRRIIPQSVIEKVEKFGREYFAGTLDNLTGIDLFNHYFFTEKLGRVPFSVGEVVAIAQSYASIVDELEDPKNFCCMEHWESAAPKRAHYCGFLYHPGMLNKMFVSADEMPHRIKFTRNRIEYLQDISDWDCIKEGISPYYYGYEEEKIKRGLGPDGFSFEGVNCLFPTAREAYAHLIDRVSGKGTWASNPIVFAYDYELTK